MEGGSCTLSDRSLTSMRVFLASAYDLRKNKKDGHSEDKTPEEPTSLEFPRDVCCSIII